MSIFHQSARNFAEAGIPVFPCEENGKRPLPGSAGFEDATTDLAQIDRWWTENPNYNVALSPDHAGWAVLDLDPASEDALATLEAENGSLPVTYEVRTPRGGRHLYFAGQLPSTVSTLGKHIDTRGVGGYVLVPPSRVIDPAKGIDGSYEVVREADLAPVPEWISLAISRKREHAKAAIEELDLPGNISRARSLLENYVKRGHVAIEGEGGDNRTYQVCCEVLNLGLSENTALDLIDEIWNPHCLPPWDRFELGVKIENASRYAQNEGGAWAVAPASEVFGATLDQYAAADAKREHRSRFYPEDDEEMDRTPPANWHYENVIPNAATVLIYGKTQSFKSFIALALGLGSATDKETLGLKPLVTGPVFYAALEGRANIKRKRRPAWRVAHEVEGVTDFYTMPAPMIAFPEEVQEFGDQITARLAGRKPAMIILDTVSKIMVGLDPTRDAPRFIRFVDSLVEAFGCTVIAIGHSGHDEKRGPRDSSAYQAGFDTVIEMKGNHRTKVTALQVVKHKDNEEPEEPYYFQGKLVGPSLVFFPISAKEHHDLAHADDPFDRHKIGAALQELNAYGPEQGVTTQVLAAHITKVEEGASVEEVEAAKARTARTLGALARSKLEAYCQRGANGLTWFLPASET